MRDHNVQEQECCSSSSGVQAVGRRKKKLGGKNVEGSGSSKGREGYGRNRKGRAKALLERWGYEYKAGEGRCHGIRMKTDPVPEGDKNHNRLNRRREKDRLGVQDKTINNYYRFHNLELYPGVL